MAIKDSTSEWLKLLEEQQNHKPAKQEKKEQQDRDIMRAFCNFINANTDEYRYWVAIGRNDVAYLGDHAKKAGIDRELAWDCSKEFIKHRFGLDDAEQVREYFDAGYELGITDLKWRRKHFKRKNA